MEQAKNAVAKVASQAVWRETTRGVWVARTDTHEPPDWERGPRRSRRAEPPEPTKASGGDTYMAALVLRGITRAGAPGVLAHDPSRGREVA